MKKHLWLRRAWILALIMLVLCLCHPRAQADLFVVIHGNTITEAIAAGTPIPDSVGARSVRTWEGEHSMTEFYLTGWGLAPSSIYYGCYYSPDDVPLPYHNAQVTLTPEDGGWTWQGEGNNHGYTKKIKDCWYFYKASF